MGEEYAAWPFTVESSDPDLPYLWEWACVQSAAVLVFGCWRLMRGDRSDLSQRLRSRQREARRDIGSPPRGSSTGGSASESNRPDPL